MGLFGEMAASYNVMVRFGLDNKQFVKGMAQVEQTTKRIGMSLTKSLTVPIIALGAATINASLKMNKAMSNVATLIPGATERVKELKGEVQDLAITMGTATADMTGGLYQVISAFGDNAETMAKLEINAQLARAGMSSVTEAINLTSAVTKGYGDISEATTRKVADLAMLTVKLGQTTFPELAASIGRTVPLAQTLGVTVEELFAGFATLTGVTGNAAEVSTQLAGMLRGMIKPTDAMTQAITGLGYESGKALIEQKGLVGAFREIIATTDGSETALGKLLPRVEGLTAVFALVGGQADVFDKKLGEMQESAGALDAAFDAATKGINEAGFTWEQFKVKLEVVAQRLGDQLLPAFSKLLEDFIIPLIEKIGIWITKFVEADKVTQTVILSIVAFAAAIGPLLIGIGQLIGALRIIIPLLSGPVGLITLLVAVGVATYAVWKRNKELNESYKESERVYRLATAELKIFEREAVQTRDKIDEMKESTDDQADAFNTAKNKVIELMDKYPKLRTEIGYTVDASGNLYDANGELIDSYDELQKAVDNFSFTGLQQKLIKLAQTQLETLQIQSDGWQDYWNFIHPLGAQKLKEYEAMYERTAVRIANLMAKLRATVPLPEAYFIGPPLPPLKEKEKDKDGDVVIDTGKGKDGQTPAGALYVKQISEAERALGAMWEPGEEFREPGWVKEGPMEPIALGELLDILWPSDAGGKNALQEIIDDVSQGIRTGLDDASVAIEDATGGLKGTLTAMGEGLAASMEMMIINMLMQMAEAIQKAFEDIGRAIISGTEEEIEDAWQEVAYELADLLGGGGFFSGVFKGLLDLLFKKDKRGDSEYLPIYAHITNWEEYFSFGFTLPSSFIYSGRAEQYDVDPHGRTIDQLRQERRTNMHYEH